LIFSHRVRKDYLLAAALVTGPLLPAAAHMSRGRRVRKGTEQRELRAENRECPLQAMAMEGVAKEYSPILKLSSLIEEAAVKSAQGA
jgi:hypothetical protein